MKNTVKNWRHDELSLLEYRGGRGHAQRESDGKEELQWYVYGFDEKP